VFGKLFASRTIWSSLDRENRAELGCVNRE
jgi:hypothetical protein